MPKKQAILIMSFGGPEGRDEVMPFLERVTRGRSVPRERLLDVAEHYYEHGGVSPINAQNRALIAALKTRLAEVGPDLPVYFGNRNSEPFINDTMRRMADDGVTDVYAFVTAAHSCFSGCRQYRQNMDDARAAVGDAAPTIHKLRVFFNHPGFIEASASRVRDALRQVADDRRDAAHLLFTAHSIPLSMADSSNYVPQLTESCRLVAESFPDNPWSLVYQSRSGPPHVPWLEPDVCDALRDLHVEGVADVVVVPIGFVSDHMEVIHDLDTEAREVADEIGLNMARAATVGSHPRFIEMVRELVVERMTDAADRPALGAMGASHDVCPVDCCPAPKRPATARRS